MNGMAEQHEPKASAADVLVETLIDWGVDIVFGIPGDGINGVVEAMRKRQDRIRFIVVRHEEQGAFMATAYAKWTGKLGCCLSTTGPGGVHLLNGLYDAKFDRAAVIAITGLPYHDLVQTSTQQDIDHVRLFEDVAEHSVTITGARQVAQAAALACRTALARRGVAHLALPVDVQDQLVEKDMPSPRNKYGASDAFGVQRILPTQADLQRAADVLNAGKKVAILAGQGAAAAAPSLLRTAELLDAPIAKALLGKSILPDDHPSVSGGVGFLGARPSQQVFDECDTLLIVGSSFPYIEYYPPADKVRAVQIDIDPARIGLRYPVETGIAGDATEVLPLLNELLKHKRERGFVQTMQEWKREWNEALEAGAERDGTPLKPQRVMRDLDRRLAADALITADCGQNCGIAAQYLHIRGEQRFTLSGTLASMGSALPYGIAAALAYPGRQVVAIAGDGGFSMSVAELATCVRYKLPVKIIVMNNSALSQIKWEQMMFLGNPEFGCELQRVDFARVAEGFGVRGFRVEKPEDCAGAIEAALAHDGPALVDAVVDPNEPMLPPKRRQMYLDNLQKALGRGTPGVDEIERALHEEPAVTSLRP